ncbi:MULTISPECIES: hypothetical protein [Bacillus cereus group]|uniref:hypothetical protein n=1 Tax=Bacillus cereus group TaxID=86661 RepID=UPI0008FDB52E|nr:MULTISPECIES: hypothetical protein [Bacillus cereus group]MDG1621961.1 hypothetical protein [Bacillus mobilis]MDX5837241.1 hypothetical protein [Bacillus cereus group sp. BfR-BA-01700]OJE31257.1 hypothetical protein BAQ44_22720 [Bacillus mobilis]HDR7243322.1 hypothetical protein [Bacillus mobilis]
MKKIQLVKDLEFNKEYEEICGKVNYDNYTCFVENLDRAIYEPEEIVNVSEVNSSIIENVVNEYRELLIKRKMNPTDKQIEFARTTAKILLGELKDYKTIPVIPAPCGFGKSTITYVFIKEVCKALREGSIQEGMIIVTDKLSDLKKIHEELEKEMGYYKNEIINDKEQKAPFTYVLEGWTEKSYEQGICKNKRMKAYKVGMCNKENCPFFNECKMSNQKTEQKSSPILLMTNARLETFGENLNQYEHYENKDGAIKSRTMIINDEKPVMVDSMSISMQMINNIDNAIRDISINNEKGKSEKKKLEEKWDQIRTMLKNKLNRYSQKYERFLVSNINNEPVLLNDEEFNSLWNKCMGNKYKNELKHIHRALTVGGLFCKTKKQEFINTISMKDIVNKNFKTVIFDATALIDPDYASSEGNAYEEIIRFINIENARRFDNITFKFHQSHKINKTQFGSKKYLADACVKFTENMPKNKATYVVTYREVATKMLKELKGRKNVLINATNKEELLRATNKVEIVADEDTIFYFGNTKGSNKAKDCVQMVQFGWNTLPDYVYSTKYLCTDFNKQKMKDILQECSNPEAAEVFSEYLMHGDKYKFKNKSLYLYQNYSMLTDFVQEVFRTKLRNYSCDEKIEINCFQADKVLIGMVEQLFPGCKIVLNDDELNCFVEEKVVSRSNGKAAILKGFIDKWPIGQELTTKEICEGAGLTAKEFDNLKSKNPYFKDLFEKYKLKRGIYIKTQ